MFGGVALTKVKTEILTAMLKSVYNGDLPCPISARRLAEAGFLGHKDDLDFLAGLDAQAVQAVLVAVIAERS